MLSKEVIKNVLSKQTMNPSFAGHEQETIERMASLMADKVETFEKLFEIVGDSFTSWRLPAPEPSEQKQAEQKQKPTTELEQVHQKITQLSARKRDMATSRHLDRLRQREYQLSRKVS